MWTDNETRFDLSWTGGGELYNLNVTLQNTGVCDGWQALPNLDDDLTDVNISCSSQPQGAIDGDIVVTYQTDPTGEQYTAEGEIRAQAQP